MPFVSRAQQRWAHTPAGIKALGGKAAVAEWDSETKKKGLKKKKKSAKDFFDHKHSKAEMK